VTGGCRDWFAVEVIHAAGAVVLRCSLPFVVSAETTSFVNVSKSSPLAFEVEQTRVSLAFEHLWGEAQARACLHPLRTAKKWEVRSLVVVLARVPGLQNRVQRTVLGNPHSHQSC
jgi:hypothetical protein